MTAAKKARFTAKFAEVPQQNAEQPRVPRVGWGSLVAMRQGGLCEIISVGIYMASGRNASRVTACIWVNPADGSPWYSGKGSASGYGYHKESAAIQEALTSAGITLYGDPYNRDASRNKERTYIGGTGSSYYEQVFKAIAHAAGYRGKMLWTMN